MSRREILALTAVGAIPAAPETANAASPAGQLVYGVHISLVPSWFDPAETPAVITPFPGCAYTAPYDELTLKTL